MVATELAVSETFYSIQGEGPTVGAPAVFLRLKGCNLSCGGVDTITTGQLDSGATWRCDTMETWLDGDHQSHESLCRDWEDKGYMKALKKGAHLVITGGESLLQQQALLSFLTAFEQALKGVPYIEIETNGTVMPDPDLDNGVSQYNVSPKLSNSGMPIEKRCIQESMFWFSSTENAIFKFVVSRKEDVQELKETYIQPFSIPHDRVYLMPAADTRERLSDLLEDVAEWCKIDGFKLSQRLQVQIWNRRVGV